ncbi:MAG: response regulator, partial [Proteobacteria bacterium]|nr:response regulator [Desulfobacula sp.]MBU4131201.1 response regulator [Pseudomonadota bacterium]
MKKIIKPVEIFSVFSLTRSRIGRNLLKWFLLMSLAPLITLSIVAFYITRPVLTDQILNYLNKTAEFQHGQISLYFSNMLLDLNLQARSEENSRLLQRFMTAFENTELPLDKFIKSYPYIKIAQHQTGNLKNLDYMKRYCNIYLIDKSGAILFTTKNEKSHGTNVFSTKTKFADACRKAFATGRPVFSDFEIYQPAGNVISAFLIEVLLDEDGEKIGLIAFRIKLAVIDAIVSTQSNLFQTYDTYLIGKDLKMRSNSSLDTSATALAEPGVKTYLTLRWQKEYIEKAIVEKKEQSVFSYIGRKNYEVFGIYSNVEIADVSLGIIGEVSKKEALSVLNRLIVLVLGSLVGIFFLVILISLFLTRRIVLPIVAMSDWAKNVAQGDFSHQKIITRQNEIQDMYHSFQTVVESLKNIVSQAKAIAEGDYGIEVAPRSKKDELGMALQAMMGTLQQVVHQADSVAKGDFGKEITPRSQKDQMGFALQKMTLSLKKAKQESNHRDWLNTGETELARLIQGETEIEDMGSRMIRFFCQTLNAQAGAFFVVQDDVLFFRSGYAVNVKNIKQARFEFGEGLVGQAAIEKKILIYRDIPQDHIHLTIDSGIGSFMPKTILVIPLVFNKAVMGVMEIAAGHEFAEHHIQFLEKVAELAAIGIHTAQSRVKLKQLLEESQSLGEELQSQQEELQAANEELKEQTLSLKSSEEELKTQSEELQASNEELMEKTEQLSRQQEMVEKARQELVLKAQKLEDAGKYKSEFLANMSHELRSPLNSLLILSQNLSENVDGNLTQEQMAAAGIIYNSGKELLSLINDILDLSKIEAGRMDIFIEEINISSFLFDLKDQFQSVADKKGVALAVEMEKDLPENMMTDGKRLRQILSNFLSNAIKFTGKGSVIIRTHLPPKDKIFLNNTLTLENTIGFSIIDTGIGIPHDKQQAIFEAFTQADGSTTRKYGGTGLGLSISRQFTMLLGGELFLTSEQDKGSIFTIYMPREGKEPVLKSDLAPSPLPGPTPPLPVNMMPFRTSEADFESFIPDERRKTRRKEDKALLIIEDDISFAKIIQDIAKKKGYKTIVAGTGREGLRFAFEHQPKGIILDLGLPDMDGSRVLEGLKQDLSTRHVPVHIISGRDEMENSLKKGAVGFLLKPVKQEDIIQALDKIQSFLETNLKKILVV